MAPQQDAGAGAEAELPEYAGHYRLESRLGSGGMGVVHLARSTSGMQLAVKVVHAEFARDPEFRGRFRQEVGAARRVSGAFTAPVVDADPEAERPWMATLFIPGPTLADQVKRNGPMDPAQLRRLMAGLAEALRDIHRVGVVHRDLKPSNVLLADDGPKVIDFGISRPKDSELRTETGKLIGTPPFMAPEQFRRPREVGPAADIFALGSVLVHAATGRGPFDSDSPYVVAYQVVHDEPDLTGVPGNLAPLVVRCLAKEPEDRPTPDELMRELRSVAASYDTQAFIPAQRAGAGAAPPKPEPDPELGQGLDPKLGQGLGQEPQAARGARVGEKQPGKPPPGRRRGRLLALGAGAIGLTAVVALASVQLLGGGDPTPEHESPRTASAAFGAWAAAPAPTKGTPQCSYGAGKVLCAQTGLVFALDPLDGRLLWRHPVDTSHVDGAPTVAGGLVHPSSGQGNRLEALDPATGKARWQQNMPAHSGPVTAGGMLLLTGADGTVTGVDGASGDTKWSRALPGHRAPFFVSFAGDPLAYTTTTSDDDSSTRVTAVDPATGDVRWDARLKGALELIGTSDGSAFFTSIEGIYSDTKAVVRYSPTDRTSRRVTLPLPLLQARGTVHGDVVYLVAGDGSLVAVDMEARRQLWTLETSLLRTSSPVADGRHVYVTAPDGRLLAVDARDGRLLGQTPPRLGPNSDRVAADLPEPVFADGHVYASAPDGTVFAVDGHDPAAW
ncbi:MULTISPECIES: serine/threonine-protein kinase [unclassified Streptomyces]|uniref:serine/threonine-protein kinase n=1 Tax=unclassified Streptomyces TaxID=2593676 RepID=UPI002366F02D|nr:MULTISPECIES: serine/threonine-protein kinase [unclassified Streptomyces]MDF3143977.1 serine/threonine-protein kinase [Streptomyces sp. T21Q-yed]WDF40297.1 serine/threonine-protein kinase [Streptomyces sp. T12]